MDHIRLHMRIEIDHCHILVEIWHDLHIAVSAPRIVYLLDRLHLSPLHRCHGYVTDCPESGPVRTVHLTHPGAAVQETVLITGGTEHADHHLGDVTMPGGR